MLTSFDLTHVLDEVGSAISDPRRCIAGKGESELPFVLDGIEGDLWQQLVVQHAIGGDKRLCRKNDLRTGNPYQSLLLIGQFRKVGLHCRWVTVLVENFGNGLEMFFERLFLFWSHDVVQEVDSSDSH